MPRPWPSFTDASAARASHRAGQGERATLAGRQLVMAKRWLLAAAASAAFVGAVVAVWLDPPRNAGDVEPKALSPHRQATPNPNMHATWVFRPKTLHELAKRAPNAVVATVTGVNSGPTLADGSEAHPDSGLETQRSHFVRATTSQVRCLRSSSSSRWAALRPTSKGIRPMWSAKSIFSSLRSA